MTSLNGVSYTLRDQPMPGMSVGLQSCFARGLLEPEHCRTFSTTTSVASWTMSLSSPFLTISSSRTRRRQSRLIAVVASCSALHIYRTQSRSNASARGLTFMRPLWKSWFPQDAELVQFHYSDFAEAKALASNYSEQLRIDAYQSGSTNYVDIVALSARQAMGATSFSGTPENPLLFLKEISSNGNSQTVDVIFPAFPFFLYTQPRWLAYLLEPLLEHQLSGQYPYVMSVYKKHVRRILTSYTNIQ